MTITVDTVQLRFKIKPDYDQQQIQQLQHQSSTGKKLHRLIDNYFKDKDIKYIE